MKNTLYRASVYVLFAAVPLGGFAAIHKVFQREGEEGKQKVETQRNELKQEFKERRDTLKEEVKGKVEQFKQEVRERKDALKGAGKEEKQAAKQEFKERRAALGEEIKKKREEFKAEAKTRKEELKKKVGENRAERIEQFFKQMTDKFEAALDRLDGLAGRIEERINAAASSGKDVTGARSELEKGRVKIKEAASELESAKTKYAEAIKNPDVKAAFADVKKIVQGIAVKVKDAHAALIRTITVLKGVSGSGATAPPVETPASQPTQ